jgi:hypothetical protein
MNGGRRRLRAANERVLTRDPGTDALKQWPDHFCVRRKDDYLMTRMRQVLLNELVPVTLVEPA